MTTLLNAIVVFVFAVASVALRQYAMKARTFLAVVRFLVHLVLPFCAVMLLINAGWRFALIPTALWVIFASCSGPYARLELRSLRNNTIVYAKSGHAPVLYLRSFAVDAAMRSLENLLETTSITYEAEDDLWFQFNPIALGREDRTGFPKALTQDHEWWTTFVELSDKAAAIWLLPIFVGTDHKAGVFREMEHVLRHHRQKVIIIAPPAQNWRRVVGHNGQDADLQARWCGIRDTLMGLMGGVQLPEYHQTGFVCNKTESRGAGETWECREISETGVRDALSVVSKAAREETKRLRKEREAEFKASNGGLSEEDFYRIYGLKRRPIRPL